MSAKPWKKAVPLVACLGILAGIGTGCGSVPPCDIDISAVDAARGSAAKAERDLEDAEARKARLEQQVADERARQRELEARKAQLEAQLKELGGTS